MHRAPKWLRVTYPNPVRSEGRQLDGFHQVVFVFDILLLLLGKFEYSNLPTRLRERCLS